ncbi:unnamed protein product, partial [Ectocarpus sp. 12 AP-2014]
EEYAQFEIQEGDVKRANAVRWRSQQQQQTDSGLAGGLTSSTGRKKQRWG